jgi:hypothetical protein
MHRIPVLFLPDIRPAGYPTNPNSRIPDIRPDIWPDTWLGNCIFGQILKKFIKTALKIIDFCKH